MLSDDKLLPKMTPKQWKKAVQMHWYWVSLIHTNDIQWQLICQNKTHMTSVYWERHAMYIVIAGAPLLSLSLYLSIQELDTSSERLLKIKNYSFNVLFGFFYSSSSSTTTTTSEKNFFSHLNYKYCWLEWHKPSQIHMDNANQKFRTCVAIS